MMMTTIVTTTVAEETAADEALQQWTKTSVEKSHREAAVHADATAMVIMMMTVKKAVDATAVVDVVGSAILKDIQRQRVIVAVAEAAEIMMTTVTAMAEDAAAVAEVLQRWIRKSKEKLHGWVAKHRMAVAAGAMMTMTEIIMTTVTGVEVAREVLQQWILKSKEKLHGWADGHHMAVSVGKKMRTNAAAAEVAVAAAAVMKAMMMTEAVDVDAAVAADVDLRRWTLKRFVRLQAWEAGQHIAQVMPMSGIRVKQDVQHVPAGKINAIRGFIICSPGLSRPGFFDFEYC